MKAANINAIRTTHYNFGSGFFDLCDELGMYVADELPYCWVSSVGDLTMTPAFTTTGAGGHPPRPKPSLSGHLGHRQRKQRRRQPANRCRPGQIAGLDAPAPGLHLRGSKYNVELSDRHYPTTATMQSDGAAATVYPYVYMEQPNTWDVRLGADASMCERWGIATATRLERLPAVCHDCGHLPV